MNKDEIIEDFFRSLRVALTNAFSYPKDHPYFIKSVEGFKLKLDGLLAVVNPFKIGVTSSGLVVEGKTLNRTGFYDELARLLHQRKIKNIEISAGFGLQELVRFLCVLSLPQKDIFKGGGLSAILNRENMAHFKVQELDYSAFLRSEGQECSDIWGYMLKEAVYSEDAEKIEQFADSFGALIKQASENDVFGNEGISPEVNEFLVNLRNKNKEKFDKCLNDVFLWLLRNKKTLNQDKLTQLKPVFGELTQGEFGDLLKEGFMQEDSFDSLSLQLFSKISEQKDTPKITKDFFNNLNQSPGLKDNPVAVKKLRNLLSGSHDDQMSAVYRNTLDSLVKNISFSGKLFFDHQALRENYRYIILGIFASDAGPDTLQTTSGMLEKELPGVFEENDMGFVRDLWGVLLKKESEGNGAYSDFKRTFSVFVEDFILNRGLADGQEFLPDIVSSSGKELNIYLDKLFVADKVDGQVLKLFLRLFKDSMDIFYERLDQRMQDTEFLGSLIGALSRITAPESVSILKYIYFRANELVKIESLRAMGQLGKVDTDFIVRQLDSSLFALRKELFSLLRMDAKAKSSIPGLLFNIKGFMGSKNALLMENIQIASDLAITEASALIKELSRRRFFWNSQLRNKASKVLKEWKID